MKLIDWLKSHLVDDVRDAWKWFSVQSMGLAVVIIAAWVAMPDDLKSALPDWLVLGLAGLVLALGIAGRLVKQGPQE